MSLEIKIASIQDQHIIFNMVKCYIQEISNSKGYFHNSGINDQIPHLHLYCAHQNRLPILITLDNDSAGFALINKFTVESSSDWHLAEFFIQSRYQRKGLGTKASHLIFSNFPGRWEISAFPNNDRAIKFWEKALEMYKYNKEIKLFDAPQAHNRVIIKFNSQEIIQKQNIPYLQSPDMIVK